MPTANPVPAGTLRDRPSFLGSLLRPMLLRLLNNMGDGQLDVTDPDGQWKVGHLKGTDSPKAHLRIGDTSVYPRLLFGGSIAAAETYADRMWSSEDLTAVIRILARNRSVGDALDGPLPRLARATDLLRHRWRANTVRQSQKNIHSHYDLGNEFFAAFLDSTLTYSCAVFPSAESTLEEASTHKIDGICQSLKLSPKDEVIEIGTGWGSFCLHAASHYGCRVTTTTISEEQHRLAATLVQKAGLSDRITLLQQDYRDLPRLGHRFSKLVSVEMIEAVGQRYIPQYLSVCNELLVPGGLGLVQAIVINDQLLESYTRGVDFIQRYIFPGGFLPSVELLRTLLDRHTNLSVVGLRDITEHYPPTLRRWKSSLHSQWNHLRELGYPDRLLRLWDFYFCYSEAGFLERTIGDVQLLLRKENTQSLDPANTVRSGA